MFERTLLKNHLCIWVCKEGISISQPKATNNHQKDRKLLQTKNFLGRKLKSWVEQSTKSEKKKKKMVDFFCLLFFLSQLFLLLFLL